MEKVYIVTAKSAEDAVRKVKGAKDTPPLYVPTEESVKDFGKHLKSRLAKVKFDELKTNPSDVFDDVRSIYRELETLLTTGNVDWDYKLASGEDHGNKDMFDKTCEMYDDYLAQHEAFAKKFEQELADKVTDKAVKATGEAVLAKYREKIDTAKDNVMAYRDWYKDKLEKRLAKAAQPKKYNTVK